MNLPEDDISLCMFLHTAIAIPNNNCQTITTVKRLLTLLKHKQTDVISKR